MPIPENISQKHILQAISKINTEGIPPKRKLKKWALEYEGENYPCKLIISYANIYANGDELDPNPNIFTTYLAQSYLTKKGFKITLSH